MSKANDDPLPPPGLRRPSRRQLQFSLRGFFLVSTILMVWLGFHVHSARRQAVARRAILDQGGQPVFDRQITGSTPSFVPAGLRSILGEDLFGTVVRLNFPSGKPENDDCLAALTDLPHVTIINVDGATTIGDEGLTHIAAADLDCLRLIDARVTDQGLQQLRGLKRLTMLDLTGNPITDDGLQPLAALERLEYLTLRGTAVGDAGILRLAGLPKLVYLNVQETRVTPAGVAALQLLLPDCQIVP